MRFSDDAPLHEASTSGIPMSTEATHADAAATVEAVPRVREEITPTVIDTMLGEARLSAETQARCLPGDGSTHHDSDGANRITRWMMIDGRLSVDPANATDAKGVGVFGCVTSNRC